MANFSGGRENYGSFPPPFARGNYGQFFWKVEGVRSPPFPRYWEGPVWFQNILRSTGRIVGTMMGRSSSMYIQLWVHVISYKFHLAASERAGWGFATGGSLIRIPRVYSELVQGVPNSSTGSHSWLVNSDLNEMRLLSGPPPFFTQDLIQT